MPPSALEIEPLGDRTFGPCLCCGRTTRRVWGYAHVPSGGTVAAYFVEWHPGAVVEHGAAFDLILGRWGEDATTEDRLAVSLNFRWTDQTPGFMLIDAKGRHHAQGSLAARAFPRSEMESSPEVAQQAFAVVDAIWLDDARIVELTTPPA